MLSSTDWSLRLQLLGRVQGVGFRPMVYRLAQRLELGGWIANSSRGLQIELIGPRPALEQALQQLRDGPPPQSRIDQWHQRWEPLNAATDLDPQDRSRPFRIHPSLEDGANGALISPDLALCEDCRLELADRLAQGEYSLTLIELAQLVEQPLAKLEQRQGVWRWRDWEVQPTGDEGRWRLHRAAAGSTQSG